ncbi:Variant-specific surface protein [Giardia duodenalis]|uniref:Variant-specific surface protein n=1 Tax=Giardia intestinalis TaxID=5741 RepID=V6U2W0_GIAIN|nr:Variant-specific surface protein [Giardia intestinalis]
MRHLRPAWGGCYSIRAAPGSGVCREARDGACVRHAEEARAEAREPRTGCQAQDTGGPETCHTCGAVIDEVSYCSQCNDSGSEPSSGAPTDGTCQADNAVCSAKSNGVCTTCTGSSFMFKGGCYATANAPGKTMCTQAANGICSAAAAGYFVPPTADRDATKQSVIPCGDDSVITVKDNKQYKGVANCLTCTAPGSGNAGTPTAATCTKCADGYFGNTCTACHQSCLTCSDAGTNKCTACTVETHFLASATAEGPCVPCGDAAGSGGWTGVTGCAKCTKPNTAGAATCTECGTDLYLKTETGGATSCVASDKCTGGFFPMTDTADSNKKKCLACSDGTNGIANCAECTAPAQGKTKPACTKCTTPNYLKTVDGTTTCVAKDTCKDGFFTVDDPTNGHKCVSCGDEAVGVPNCAKCNPPTGNAKPICITCRDGYTLDSQANTCASASANRSALSTGAIAGISVAAVVVVGGLVGFLCWWFVCRGKA